MSKILKKVMAGTLMALSLAGGVAAAVPGVTACAMAADTDTYYRDYNKLRMHNRYRTAEGGYIVEVEVAKDTYEDNGLSLEFGESYYTSRYTCKVCNGTETYWWGEVSAYYNNDTSKYLVTYKVNKDALFGPVSLYCYLHNGVIIFDDNNGNEYRWN